MGSGQLLFSGRANAAERKSRMNLQVASINHDFILLLLACMLHFNLGFRNKEVSPATSSWKTKMMGTPWGPWNDYRNGDRNSPRNSKIACWSLCIWGLPYTTVSYELIILPIPMMSSWRTWIGCWTWLVAKMRWFCVSLQARIHEPPVFTHQNLGQFNIHPKHQRGFTSSLTIVGGGEELPVQSLGDCPLWCPDPHPNM